MPLNTQPLLEALTQNPLLIASGSEGLFQSSVTHLVNSEHASKMLDYATMASNDNDDEDFWPTTDGDWRAYYRPYNVKDGTLQIPVMGVLLNRFPFQFGRWATGYKYIEMALKRGLADGNVKRIAFIIDSPGGEVAGCFECGDKIFEARSKKPMRAFSADHAYSAAYLIYSSVGKGNGTVTRSGGVGSIGVVTAHVEYSEALKQMGIKVTFIFAGKHKVDGNSYEKLPEAVKSRIEKRINKIYGVFTSTVARNRDMDDEEVKATEALTYDAQDGIDIGLADRLGSLEDEMAIFNTEANTEDSEMANDNKVETVTKAEHDSALASATAAGIKTGAEQATSRIKGILACENAKTRPKAALSFALNTDMSVDAANAVLADLGEETTTTAKVEEKPNATDQQGDKNKAKTTPFEDAMNKQDQPNVGASATDAGGDDKSDDALASSILSDYAGATGQKREKAA
jgi:signal peptide peptidase SppA